MLLSKELITHAVYSKHADLCQCSREEEERTERWRGNGVKKRTYLTFDNIAHLAGIMLVFGKKVNPGDHSWLINAIYTPMQSCSTRNPLLKRLQNSPPSLLSPSLLTTDKKEVYKM